MDEKDTQEEIVEKQNRTEKVMYKFLQETKQPPIKGDLVEGVVLMFDKSTVYVDLQLFGTGIIYGREYINARDMIKNMHVGDSVTATVVEEINDEGYIELSLKEARQALIWSEAENALQSKKVFDLQILDANKGGLIIEWQGLQGFLPASQLKSEHYPRIEDGDKDKILSELKKLIGEKLSVAVIAIDQKEGKLIFSEKSLGQEEKNVIVGKYSVGDEVSGEITGIVDFGIFIKVEDGLEGLAHLSELSWSLVEDPRKLFAVGEKVKARVIEVNKGKISLSVKQLTDNPWSTAEKKYKKDMEVDGVVIKYNKHGALVSIEEGVAGLAHVSEFESTEKLREALELGKSYKFKINLFEPKEQRMTLSVVEK
jgi:small subunit ribosomal protein S1